MTRAIHSSGRPFTRGWAAVVGLVVVVGVITVIIQSRLDPAAVQRVGGFDASPVAAVGAVLMICGALICSQHPRHPTGLQLVIFGAIWMVDGLLAAWATWGLSRPLPGVAFGFWFVDRVGAVLLLGLPLLVLTYPSGRLPTGRLGRFARIVVAAAAALPVLLILVPYEIASLGTPPSGLPVWDPIRLPLPAGVWITLLTVARALALSAPLAAVIICVLRYRRAGAEDRVRLRYLLWAGIVAVILVGLSLALPASQATVIVLYLAVIISAISVTVGLLAPHRIDVDTLVVGTVLYAGVALVIVLLDLALVAAGTALLGPRLDQRSVTLLVILVAVAGYVPLRAALWALLRRAVLGRRGDRYEVITTLAARLEAADGVADQLPTLAESVADAFGVSFVEVEIVQPSGDALVAVHGQRPTEVSEQPISYRGERIGRLVLPSRGFRALMSARDRRLLLDVVRQAAIAVRTARLAADLQAGREALLLAREDDRRRIRNDLHDGLGPALTGVAMRLEAAASLTATDPERAGTLITQSRSDVLSAVADVRRLVHGLRPPALDDLGLYAALDAHADALRAAGTEVEIVGQTLRPLSAAVEVAAYRIVAEALTNVARHADANRCRVGLLADQDSLAITVADDGRGIPETAAAGVGLSSIRERAAELGGRAEFGDGPSGGTTVAVRLPLVGAMA